MYVSAFFPLKQFLLMERDDEWRDGRVYNLGIIQEKECVAVIFVSSAEMDNTSPC